MWAMHCPSDVAALRLGLALELVLLAERVQVADDASLGSEAESGQQHRNTEKKCTHRARVSGRSQNTGSRRVAVHGRLSRAAGASPQHGSDLARAWHAAALVGASLHA